MAYTTISKSTDYFDTKLYTQSGSSNNGNTQTLTMDNVGFVWIKNRDYSNGNCLFDIVRGGDKLLASNSNGIAETAGGGITFGSSDTTIGADTGGYGFNNRVGDDYVAWHWRTDGTTGSSNSDGSISSTVSVNTTSGFSIATYAGNGASSGTATVGHGLGAVPQVVLQKRTTGSVQNWHMYHIGTGNGSALILNDSQAKNTQTDYWGDTTPTSSVVTVGPNNLSTGTNVLYSFTEKQGFSKFGRYTGTGSSNGPFVYTGFKPAFVLVKNASDSQNWFLQDNKRLGYNEANHLQKPNNAGADDTGNHIDILSNGFKTIVSSANCNGSGHNIVYMAFAEMPLVGSNDTPALGR